MTADGLQHDNVIRGNEIILELARTRGDRHMTFQTCLNLAALYDDPDKAVARLHEASAQVDALANGMAQCARARLQLLIAEVAYDQCANAVHLDALAKARDLFVAAGEQRGASIAEAMLLEYDSDDLDDGEECE